MSDNIAALHLGIDFIRPRNLSPHMKRITLAKIRSALEEMRLEVTIDPAVAARAARGRVDARAMTAASLDVGRAPVIIGGGLGLVGLMTAFRLTPMPAVVLAKAPLGAEASRAGPRAA
jgi:hypothetical protein